MPHPSLACPHLQQALVASLQKTLRSHNIQRDNDQNFPKLNILNVKSLHSQIQETIEAKSG